MDWLILFGVFAAGFVCGVLADMIFVYRPDRD